MRLVDSFLVISSTWLFFFSGRLDLVEMPPRPSLKNFLASARAALVQPRSQQSAPLTFVVGNESAGRVTIYIHKYLLYTCANKNSCPDLDSLCSAVVFAYLRSSTADRPMHIPVANLTRPDLALRTEMACVLRHAGLRPSDLITLSEVSPQAGPSDTSLWMLVDHNCLTGPLSEYAGRVIGCVDHHADEAVISSSAKLRVVEPCGSCMSLVVHECREVWDSLAGQAVEGGEDAKEDDEKLAMLGLAPILVDTINLTSKDKVRPKDLAAVAYLKQKLRNPDGLDTTAYFDEITKVKEDISSLSFRDIFRKDYKEWTEQQGRDQTLRLGISCVVQDLDYLVDKAGDDPESLVREFGDWVSERKLDVAAIMTTSHPGGEFQRNLLVWGASSAGIETVHRFRAIAGERSLGLETWGDGALDDGDKRLAWRQGDLTSSRKQVAPLLREAMKKA